MSVATVRPVNDARYVISLCLGQWEANAVMLINQAAGVAAVVDPGQGADLVVPAVLDELNVDLETILLTHGHLDHLWSAPDLARATGAEVWLHPADDWLWRQPAAAFGAPPSALASFGLTWEVAGVVPSPVTDRQRLTVAGFAVEVHHTPGHTPGHVTYVGSSMLGVPIAMIPSRVDHRDPDQTVKRARAAVAAAGVGLPQTGADNRSGDRLPVAPDQTMMSGDLLFAGSIGRTDLAWGSFDDIMTSLAETMQRCADDVLVIPGHGPATTIGNERRTNPYVAQSLQA